VYWDTSVFLSLFQRGATPELQYQREQAVRLVEEARDGETLIITSAFTLAEARRGEGVPPLPGEEHATLNAFFKHSYIEVVPVDRGIGELAAEYGERFRLSPADAVQLATAVRVKASVFLAWDQHFHRSVAMKDAPIPIEEPRWTATSS
jgi:predicted nucleic acid-binding protein